MWSSLSDSKTEESIYFESFPLTPNKCHRRVVLTGDITFIILYSNIRLVGKERILLIILILKIEHLDQNIGFGCYLLL